MSKPFVVTVKVGFEDSGEEGGSVELRVPFSTYDMATQAQDGFVDAIQAKLAEWRALRSKQEATMGKS